MIKRLIAIAFVILTLFGAEKACAGAAIGAGVIAIVTQASVSEVNIAGAWTMGLTHAKEPGNNRALVFIAHVEIDSDVNLTSVTYGGQSMTKVIDEVISSGSNNTRAYVAGYILNEAGVAAATDGNFIGAWSATPSAVAYASVFLEHVDQAAFVGATDSNSITGSGGVTLTTSALATGDGGMVIVAATCGNSSGTYTVNNGFVEAVEQTMSNTAMGVVGYKDANGAAETPSVTHSNTNRQVLIGFVVRAEPVYKLTVSSSAGGTVTQPGIGDFNYPDGNVVNLVAIADLNYHFVNWTGTAVDAGRVADPNSATTNVTMDANYTMVANFADDTVVISGTITTGDSAIAEVSLIGLGVVTDANGFYNATVDSGWSGTVTPEKSGYTFDPNGRSYTNVTADQTDQNYAALPSDNFDDDRKGTMWRYKVE